jgi:tetratricopeptide (TPR) repeat protein
VTGTGSGTYLYYGRELRPPEILVDPVYAHNDYLQFLAEFGVVGATMFLIFLFSHGSFGWKSLMWSAGQRSVALGRLRSDSLALNIAALSAVVTCVVHSVVDFNLHIPANAMLMAFVFGILANPGVMLPLKEAQFPRVSHYAALALPALALWMAFAGLRTWQAEYYSERARVALRDEQYADSIRFARQGISWDSTNPALYLYLGQAHSGYAEIAPHARAATNSWNAAVQAFRKGLRYFPRDLWLLLGMGEALDVLKQFDEAETVYQQLLKWNPKSAPVRARYATHLRLSGRLDEAEAEYKRSLALVWTYEATVGLEQLAKDLQARVQ